LYSNVDKMSEKTNLKFEKLLSKVLSLLEKWKMRNFIKSATGTNGNMLLVYPQRFLRPFSKRKLELDLKNVELE